MKIKPLTVFLDDADEIIGRPFRDENNLFTVVLGLVIVGYGVKSFVRKSVAPTDVDRAYANLSGFNRDQYEQLMLTLSVSQKKLLIALARERTNEFSDAYRRRHALGVSSTVNSAKAKLMEDGHVERYDGRYTIADPFFAQYLRMA